MSKKMMSPVLADTLANDVQAEMQLMEISDSDMLKEFFTQFISKSLIQKKKTLVIIPDKMGGRVPSHILSKSNLAHYTCLFQQQPIEDELLKQRIRILANLKEIPVLRQEFNHLNLKQKEIRGKIRDALLLINKKGVKNPSFKDMLLSRKKEPAQKMNPSTIEEIGSVHINPTVIDSLKNLQKCYKPRFPFMDECAKMTVAALQDSESLHFAQSEIAELVENMRSTILNIETALFEMKKTISHELDIELSEWSKIKELLQEGFLEYEIDNYPSSFEDNGYPHVQKLFGYKYLKLSLDISPEKGWGQVPQILDIITAIMGSAHESIGIYFQEYVRKLSLFNTENEYLDTEVQKGLQLLKSLNSSKYIEYSSKTQFLQIDSFLKVLKSGYNQAQLCLNALQDKEYIEFRSLVSEINLPDNVIKSLYNTRQSSWSDIVEYFGHQSHLTTTYDSSISRLTDWYTELKNCHLHLNHLENKELHNRWCSQRNQALTNIKNQNWEFYQDLFENNEKQCSFQDLLEELGNDLQVFFPTMIVHEKDIKYVMSHPNVDFDNAIFLDIKDISITDVSVLLERQLNVTIATTYNLDVEDLTSEFNIVKNFCSDALIERTQRLTSLDRTERYHYSIKLAGLICNTVDSVNIYKVNQYVFISCLHNDLDRSVQKHLNVSPQHYLHVSTNEISHLVETLIHYENIVVLTENGLLNDSLAGSILWQKDVIKILKDSDLSVYNMNYSNLYHNFEKELDGVYQAYSSVKKELIVSTPKLELEKS